MPPLLAWNRSGVPEETPSSSDRILFVRHRRLHALVFGLLSAGVAGIGGKVLLGTKFHLLGLGFVSVWAFFASLFLMEALTAVWTQRLVMVDVARHEVHLFGRSPRGPSRVVYPFSALHEIRVDRPEEGPSSVILSVDGEKTILLGRDFDERATSFARRFAQVTGIPLRP